MLLPSLVLDLSVFDRTVGLKVNSPRVSFFRFLPAGSGEHAAFFPESSAEERQWVGGRGGHQVIIHLFFHIFPVRPPLPD